MKPAKTIQEMISSTHYFGAPIRPYKLVTKPIKCLTNIRDQRSAYLDNYALNVTGLIDLKNNLNTTLERNARPLINTKFKQIV